jgi:hypothetical protein
MSFSISCSESDSEPVSESVALSDAEDAELDDEMYSTFIGTRLDEATALGRA